MKIGVVDYGMGNLHSVAKALASTKGNVLVSDQKSKLADSNLLVVPGVGAFGAAMKNLAKHKVDDFIANWIQDDKPFLGICLGLQLLFERSEESPKEKGLSVFKGDVVKFRPSQFKKGAYQVPHMGWNTVKTKKQSRHPGESRDPGFKPKEKNWTPAFAGVTNFDFGIGPNDYFYFVHTYYPKPKESSLVFTETNYGKPFCSAVQRGRLIATQFHPEKSGEIGLKLLKNIVKEFS